jgi:hypothetical protein
MHTITLSDQELRTVRYALASYFDDELKGLPTWCEDISEIGTIISVGANIRACSDVLKRLPSHPPID